MVSVVVGLYSIAENISTISLQNSPEFQIVQQLMPSAMISPAAIYFEIILNAALITASIGLYLRLNWGRIMFMVVVFIFTLWQIYSSISSYLALNTLLAGYGVGNTLPLIVLWSVFGVGINVFLIWKLSSVNIRSEFGRSDAAKKSQDSL